MRLVYALMSTVILLWPGHRGAAEIRLQPAFGVTGEEPKSASASPGPEKPEDAAPASGIILDARKPEPRLDESRGSRSAYPSRRSRFHAVAGYHGSHYVYGEVQMLDGKQVAGYLYRVDGRNVISYIYGERVGEEGVGAYDAKGNYYALKLLTRQRP
ncbi:MAG: hypothetical protein ACT4QB_22900 [Gammaproteobacteria bacterium]